jgi:hypothetical protein
MSDQTLVVWSDELTSLGANPLVIEVKRTFTPEATYQLARAVAPYLTAANTVRGLVVYFERQVSVYLPFDQDDHQVLFVKWARLLQLMGEQPFPRVIASLMASREPLRNNA